MADGGREWGCGTGKGSPIGKAFCGASLHSGAAVEHFRVTKYVSTAGVCSPTGPTTEDTRNVIIP